MFSILKTMRIYQHGIVSENSISGYPQGFLSPKKRLMQN
jgi:hypothetical protein